MPVIKLLAVVIAAGVLTLSGGPAALADTTVGAALTPLNGSGASGTVTMTSHSDGSLTVVIHAHGLVPNQPHAQHIHGSAEGGHFMCPSAADDTNGDGILTNEEAMGEYGTIYMSLTTHGGTSARAGLALDRMPVADAQGRLSYHRTFPASAVPAALSNQLAHVHVVIHGIDVNHNGRYDRAALGISTFARNLGLPGVPEEATDPAACGVVTRAGIPVKPMGGVETGRGAPYVDAGGPHVGLAIALFATSLALLAAVVGRRVVGSRRTGDG